MASTAPSISAARERRFFLLMAIAIAAIVFAGFGSSFALGRARLGDLPIQVHLHALAFAAWIILFVVQSALVDRGSFDLHRRLGRIGAALVPLMVALGMIATVMCVRRGAVPPFFPVNVFLVMNMLGVLAFAGLTAAGIALRARPEWHRRLMLCGTIELTAPAFGRLLPMPLLGSWGPAMLCLAMMVLVAIGMGFDGMASRRVHPAWWVGAAVILAVQLAIGPLAFAPPVADWAASLTT
ncbi:MAG: hypothetical protein QM688_04275 [Sphingomonas bacterium]